MHLVHHCISLLRSAYDVGALLDCSQVQQRYLLSVSRTVDLSFLLDHALLASCQQTLEDARCNWELATGTKARGA